MLVADLNEQRIYASEAERGLDYKCPDCTGIVILRRGRIRVSHFAHKPPSCGWGRGETDAHLKAKLLFKEEFARRGLRAEVEFAIHSPPNSRRADVMIWSPNGVPYAIELQHTDLGYEEIELRTRSYIDAGVRVIWIPFFRRNKIKNVEKISDGNESKLKVTEFPIIRLERWVHGFNFGELWMYDPVDISLWRGKLKEQEIPVEERQLYNEYGEEEIVGGYSRQSKRWRELTLWGPYSLHDVRISTINRRSEGRMGKHIYPKGIVGKLVLDSTSRR